MHGNRETLETPAPQGAGRSEKAIGRTADMHVSRESDGPIVPEKRANKAGPKAAAESVEGRGSTKGNAQRHITASGGTGTVAIAVDAKPGDGNVPAHRLHGNPEWLQCPDGCRARPRRSFHCQAREPVERAEQSEPGGGQVQIAYPIWTGAVSTAWNTSSVKNWILNTTSGSTNYIQGDSVVFDDTPGLNSVVTISGTNVLPSSVQFNNNNYSYTLQGTAGIAGSASVTINGGGGVTFSNSNSYTGGTFINAGTVTAANANAFPNGPGTGNVAISSTASTPRSISTARRL